MLHFTYQAQFLQACDLLSLQTHTGSLDDILVQDGCLPEKVVWGFIRQVAAGLQYLHRNGILYCDLRPTKVSGWTGRRCRGLLSQSSVQFQSLPLSVSHSYSWVIKYMHTTHGPNTFRSYLCTWTDTHSSDMHYGAPMHSHTHIHTHTHDYYIYMHMLTLMAHSLALYIHILSCTTNMHTHCNCSQTSTMCFSCRSTLIHWVL